MIRTLSLGAVLAASCAAGALALAPTQAYVFANFYSAAIDAQAHAQGIAVAMLAFGAGLVGLVLSGIPPFTDAIAASIQPTEVKNIAVAMKVEVDDSALDRARAKAEGLAAVAGSIFPHFDITAPMSAATAAPQGEIVTLIRGEKGRFRSVDPSAKPKRRRPTKTGGPVES